MPAINWHPIAFPILVGALSPGLCLAVNPNQNRMSTIGRMYTTNGTGALTGVSRVLFSLGECLSPIVCINSLYPIGSDATALPSDPRLGTTLPYILTAVIHIIVLIAYASLGISPSTDPDPAPRGKHAAAAPLPAPASTTASPGLDVIISGSVSSNGREEIAAAK